MNNMRTEIIVLKQPNKNPFGVQYPEAFMMNTDTKVSSSVTNIMVNNGVDINDHLYVSEEILYALASINTDSFAAAQRTIDHAFLNNHFIYIRVR